MNTVQFRAIDLLALSRLIATFVMFVAAIPMVTAQEEKAKKELETAEAVAARVVRDCFCLLYTSPSPRDGLLSRMPSSA